MANLSFVEWAEERGNVHLEHFIALSPADWHDSATVGAAEMRVNELYNAVGGGPNTAAEAQFQYHYEWRFRTEERVNPIETRRLRQGPATEADLRALLQNIRDRVTVIGITERFTDSLRLFVWALAGERLDDSDPMLRAHAHDSSSDPRYKGGGGSGASGASGGGAAAEKSEAAAQDEAAARVAEDVAIANGGSGIMTRGMLARLLDHPEHGPRIRSAVSLDLRLYKACCDLFDSQWAVFEQQTGAGKTDKADKKGKGENGRSWTGTRRRRRARSDEHVKPKSGQVVLMPPR